MSDVSELFGTIERRLARAGACPDCGGDANYIVWGEPHDGLMDSSLPLDFAGCAMPHPAPEFSCRECEALWSVKRRGVVRHDPGDAPSDHGTSARP